MKIRNLLLAAMLAGVSAFSGMAFAQNAGGAGGGRGRLNFLSAEDRQHLMRVRQQALADNPDLKTEQESLMKEREYVKNKGADATADDKQTLRNNFMAHGEKMEAAMVKIDSTVQPIIDQVKAKMKERFEQHSGGDADSNSSQSGDSGNP
jgi:hypothetical protein